MGFSVLPGLGQQQLELMFRMSTADVLQERTLLPLVLDYLNGSRSGLGPNGSDCQVSAHGSKIPLVRKLENQKMLKTMKIIT
ncbi:MAG: hypothetical protein WCG19_10945 [Chlorobiaceae bacterium]